MTKLFSLILTFLATSIGSALAQSYPTRTVNIIIAFPPGGPNEGVVRFLAEKLTSSLGQAVIIENRPGGAGGTVGTRSVANATPDGHTLLLSPPGPLVVAPLIYKNVGYDPAKAFTPITALFSIAAKAYEAGVAQRVVVIEFDSVEKAVAAHDSEGYQAALKVFGKAAERDLRIVEGLA
jgi:tripartite-type tricarboxylate transporter receptor subunit TctC